MDDHGPRVGCKYTECGLGDPANCPFVKDGIANEASQPTGLPVHQHQYVLVCSCGDIKPITPPKPQHDIITPPNRGEWRPE